MVFRGLEAFCIYMVKAVTNTQGPREPRLGLRISNAPLIPLPGIPTLYAIENHVSYQSVLTVRGNILLIKYLASPLRSLVKECL